MGNADEVKGQIKRGMGELRGDEKLKREGSIDEAAGKAKDSADKVADKARSLKEND
jgi:uncharacterized protein YjbJ (UPF0337 family)